MSCCNHDCNQGRDCDCHIDEELVSIGKVFYVITTVLAGFGLGSAVVLIMLFTGMLR